MFCIKLFLFIAIRLNIGIINSSIISLISLMEFVIVIARSSSIIVYKIFVRLSKIISS